MKSYINLKEASELLGLELDFSSRQACLPGLEPRYLTVAGEKNLRLRSRTGISQEDFLIKIGFMD